MVFVTGGTGFLGSHLIYQLVKKGENVRALKRDGSNFDMAHRVFSLFDENGGELFKQIDWVEGDLLDVYSLEDFLEGIDVIYHCGALVSFQQDDKTRMQKVNIEGTANLVNAALIKKIKKLCHVSSIAAIGRADNDHVIDEDMAWKSSRVNSSYAVSKYGAEREVWRGIEEGLDAVIVNPSVILGPGELKSGIASMIRMVRKGFSFYTHGVNGFVDVRDVAKAMIALTEKDISGQRFIISAENLMYRQIFNWIAESYDKQKPKYPAGKWMSEIAWRLFHIQKTVTNKKPLITKETARTANNKYLYSNKKITDLLGFQFLPVEQSVKDSCRFFDGFKG
ncbi:MAG: NAD-dependent epimerase/dehydratase family protein [Chlorobi bacterium]|nr:NAD-dependent epimerase/dehydratase family protein [Chlorobiota bacterium]